MPTLDLGADELFGGNPIEVHVIGLWRFLAENKAVLVNKWLRYERGYVFFLSRR